MLRYVLYFSSGQPQKVRLGDWNLKRSADEDTTEFDISRIIVHPLYNETMLYNDIALLKLREKITFRNTIRPACLFDKDEIPVNKYTATGWGRNETCEYYLNFYFSILCSNNRAVSNDMI